MSEQVELTGRFTTTGGDDVVITKKTAVPYRHAVVLTTDDGHVVDVRYSKSYTGAEQHYAAIVRDYGLFGSARYENIYEVTMKRPSKFRVNGAFTPEQIALIETALGRTLSTTEIHDAV